MVHERRRTGWLVLTVVAVLVFLLFAAGTTYSLLAPDYVFEDGELAGEAAILSGSLALAALGGYRLRAADRRLRTLLADYGAWLPARDATNGEGRVDLDAETARLRRTAHRAAGLALAWAVVFGSGLAGVIAADRSAADLLATGVRVEGVVLSVHDPVKGTPSIFVRYHSPGVSWTEEIARDSGRGYHVGDVVTVVYDAGDPEHVRTTDEANENVLLVGFSVIPLLAGFGGLPFALTAAAGWRRRARAAARTGWRVARVTVVPSLDRRGRMPEVRVHYRDGSGIVLRCARSTHGPGALAGQEGRRAWIGGWGRQMVVLFPFGPVAPGPYAVPAYAIGMRTQPMSPVR
ncbi:DUF3592 domain-containing protein [Amycolatopsis mongoliensis]|uniref:DUF3592 domain-containing protein n=1 Tax=Amycolatopsis mongoliensis TaxID=715475 RepID=A0A9Y2K0C3_9PSEU|nr:DUF3592 domain-containing protein [Amycolatopsis sp. 4-36]WIY06984.1 DUF3592 domain-containing protein [Amycolatopsis sp. 4-36]